MRRPLNVSSLRRTLVAGALVIAALASAGMLIAFSLAIAQRRAIDRETNAFITEQQVADEIVALTYRQQLAALQFLERHDESSQRDFRALGDQAYGQMRRYLFHELSDAARLQVERMKEEHQSFEVAAQRVFYLAERGESDSARMRMAGLSEHAAALDSAVGQFLAARVAQRETFQQYHEGRTRQLRTALVGVTVLLFALGVWLAGYLRRRVLAPLDDLADAAKRLGAGDLDARVPDQRYIEFNEVASGFNQMANNVQTARETMVAQNEEIRQTLDQLERTQEELVQHEKLSAMGQMLAGVAHELNNPLAGVLGMAELLEQELWASRNDEMIRLAAELASPLASEATRARDLVRNLLSFARKPTGAMESVALSAAVRLAIGLRASAYAKAGKTLEMDIAPSLYVTAETQKLQLVMVNLVNNALDAMTTDHGTALRISALPGEGDTVQVFFDDDGPGFVDPNASFEPFYTTKPPDRGTGLGLTLVQKYVHEFGGSMRAENRAEGGARVTIGLRRAPVPPDDVGATPVPAPRLPRAVDVTHAQPPSNAEPHHRAGRSRVLVVDDEASLREIQRRMLLLEEIDVLVASNGEEAQRILSTESVDLVISDLRMPGKVDGRGLLAWIEEHKPHLADRVLIVTGDVTGLPSGVASGLSAERVLSKPFTREEYVARVRAELERHH